MKRVYLAPVSGSQLFNNYLATVESGVQYGLFATYVNSNSYLDNLPEYQPVHIWGVKMSKVTPYGRVQKDDYLFFYHKGKIISYATVLFKATDKELSKLLWGFEIHKLTNLAEYWEYLIFLSKPININLDFEKLILFADYKTNASVRGFNEYRPTGVSRILQEYKSLDAFLKTNV